MERPEEKDLSAGGEIGAWKEDSHICLSHQGKNSLKRLISPGAGEGVCRKENSEHLRKMIILALRPERWEKKLQVEKRRQIQKKARSRTFLCRT